MPMQCLQLFYQMGRMELKGHPMLPRLIKATEFLVIRDRIKVGTVGGMLLSMAKLEAATPETNLVRTLVAMFEARVGQSNAHECA